MAFNQNRLTLLEGDTDSSDSDDSYAENVSTNLCQISESPVVKLPASVERNPQPSRTSTPRVQEFKTVVADGGSIFENDPDDWRQYLLQLEKMKEKHQADNSVLQERIQILHAENTKKSNHIKELEHTVKTLKYNVETLNRTNEEVVNKLAKIKEFVNGTVGSLSLENKTDCLKRKEGSLNSESKVEISESTKAYERKEKIVSRGLEVIVLEKKNVDRTKAEAMRLLEESKNALMQHKQFVNSAVKSLLTNLGFEAEKVRESAFKEVEKVVDIHLTESQKRDEGQNILKKKVAEKLNSFNEKLATFKDLEKRIQSNFEKTVNLHDTIREDIVTIRDWNLSLGSKGFSKENGSSKSLEENGGNENAEVTIFTEKLSGMFWNAEDDQRFKFGLSVHKYITEKKLKIEEILLKNQFVSLLVISKDPPDDNDNDNLSELLASGYGDDCKVSFIKAVENLSNNRLFKKKLSRAPSARASTAGD